MTCITIPLIVYTHTLDDMTVPFYSIIIVHVIGNLSVHVSLIALKYELADSAENVRRYCHSPMLYTCPLYASSTNFLREKSNHLLV